VTRVGLSSGASGQSPNQLPDYPITQLPDSRCASAIGRSARLDLVFEARRGRTLVAHSYVEPPFRIGRSFDVDGAAYVILVCSGPGVFAGDALELSIRVRSGARAILASQSALQVHPSTSSSPAVIRHRYVVEGGGELQAHWDPVIPFAAARLDQRFELQIDERSRVYWSDALMSGRVSRAETWAFECVAHELQLRVGTSLKYLERYTLRPNERPMAQPWVGGSMHYMSTALTHHGGITPETAELLQRAVQPSGDNRVHVAVDLLEPDLVVARLLASCGAPFAEARASVRRLALASVFGCPPELRK
jgi:urease accessory protein UreH